MDDMISFLIEYFSIRTEEIESTGSNENGTYIRCHDGKIYMSSQTSIWPYDCELVEEYLGVVECGNTHRFLPVKTGIRGYAHGLTRCCEGNHI